MVETKNTGRGRPKKDFDRKYIRKTPKKAPNKIKTKTKKIATKRKKEKKQVVHKWLYIVWIFILAIFVFSLLLDKYKNKITTEEYWKIIISNIPEDMDLPIVQEDENIDEINIETWSSIDLSTWDILSWSDIQATVKSGIIINAIDNTQEVKEYSPKNTILETFYQKLIWWEADTASDIVDLYLKNTKTYETYYTSKWVSNFISLIDENSFQINEIEKLENNVNKPNNEYYSYILSYTINNKKYQEKRETTIINRNWNKQIGSLQCVSKWCSTSPFFNPEKYN